MSTRSKTVWIVIGVIIGIALMTFTHMMTLPTNRWLFWFETVFFGLAILSLILHGRADIFKVLWLEKAERFEADASKGRPRPKKHRSKPPASSAKRPVNTQITADAQHDERIQQ